MARTDTALQRQELVEQKLSLMTDEIASIHPVDASVARRAMQMITIMSRRELAGCTLRSIALAGFGVVKLGLMPDPQLGQAYIIPFREKGVLTAKLIVGYKGYLELARRGGMGAIRINPVWANDTFEYADGWPVVLRHVPYWMAKKDSRGEMVAAYLVAHVAGHPEPIISVRSVNELDEAKKHSRSARKGSGPWIEFPNQMRLKTLIRQSHAMLPCSSDPSFSLAMELDRRGDTEGEDQEGALRDIPGARVLEVEPLDEPLAPEPEPKEGPPPEADPKGLDL